MNIQMSIDPGLDISVIGGKTPDCLERAVIGHVSHRDRKSTTAAPRTVRRLRPAVSGQGEATTFQASNILPILKQRLPPELWSYSRDPLV